MPSRRRLIPLVTVASFLVLILYQLNNSPGNLRYLVSTYGPQAPLYTPPPRADDGRFSWSDLPVKHPATSMIQLPQGRPKRLPRIQSSFGTESAAETRVRQERLSAVKSTFDRCWSSYQKQAWLKDELAPLSGNHRQTFGGWAATLVDALDTLWIMGMREDFERAVSAVATIDFTTSTDTQINVFETTIRYLGGFLSAYDLSGNKVLLDKAVEVGEMLYISFDTPNRMPLTRWDIEAGRKGAEQPASEGALVAEVGSLSLEFTRLSQLTGNPKYFDAISRITEVLDDHQGLTNLPGLWPVLVNARDQIFYKDAGFTLGGMADSLYEYFPKEFALLGGLSPVYEKLYKESMETAIKQVFFRPMTRNNEDILFSGDVRAETQNDRQLEPKCQHLTCFVGGMLALGGRLFSLPEHVSIGRKLVDGCIWAYKALPLGIMPELFHLVPCPHLFSNCTLDEQTWYDKVKEQVGSDRTPYETVQQKRLPFGFTNIDDARYILRPEALESIFILYRITGDRTLMDSAWEMYSAIEKYTATDFANAALDDVTVLDGKPPKSDRMESFWMAETLKYLYLLFSETDVISLDEWIFNTEAHPLKRPR
jgi:mannosyl-oligosaccharide alpha-1,2-mannosidase